MAHIAFVLEFSRPVVTPAGFIVECIGPFEKPTDAYRWFDYAKKQGLLVSNETGTVRTMWLRNGDGYSIPPVLQ